MKFESTSPAENSYKGNDIYNVIGMVDGLKNQINGTNELIKNLQTSLNGEYLIGNVGQVHSLHKRKNTEKQIKSIFENCVIKIRRSLDINRMGIEMGKDFQINLNYYIIISGSPKNNIDNSYKTEFKGFVEFGEFDDKKLSISGCFDRKLYFNKENEDIYKELKNAVERIVKIHTMKRVLNLSKHLR